MEEPSAIPTLWSGEIRDSLAFVDLLTFLERSSGIAVRV
jgi:hypothetical protein